jgi:hypothetical protein
MILFGPLLAALLLAFLQLAIYALLRRFGLVQQLPFFGLLLFRSLLVVLVAVVLAALVFHYTNLGTGFEPMGMP